MPKNKLSAFLSLLLVFLSGAVVGALAHRLYMVNTIYSTGNGNGAPLSKRTDPEEVRRRIIADVKSKVHLDDSEVAALNKLMDETNDAWHKMRDRINAEGRTFHDEQWQKFRALLRPDQQSLYDQWRTERDNELRKRREQQQREGQSGPPHS
jgi:hypothetical protein